MLIAQITALLISVLAPIALCIFKKYYKTPEYEICVTGGTNTLAAGVSLLIFGILFVVFSMLSGSSGIVEQLLFYCFGILSIIICIVFGFSEYVFDYTAFCNDKIILRRSFFTKEISISEIDRITCSRGYINFYKRPKESKYYKTLFQIDASAIDAAELVHKIDERRIALNLKATETNE